MRATSRVNPSTSTEDSASSSREDERWRVLVHQDGTCRSADPEEAFRLLAKREHAVWVDLIDPRPEEVERLGRELGFHPLSVEDAIDHHQRAKIDVFTGYQLLILYAGESLDEVSAFIGQNYLVTIHDTPVAEIETARERWREAVSESRADKGTTPPKPIDIALYVLLDSIVDGYFPILDHIADEISEIEEKIFAQQVGREIVRDLLHTRKHLLTVRRLLTGERDVVNTLARRELDVDRNGTTIYFLDVYDHLVRVIESLDVYHDMTASALDAHLSVTSYRLNETVKKMTAVGTVMMSLAIITGVYGMNFKHMPELEWTYGYPFAIGVMAFVAGLIVLVFRKFDWL